MGLNYGEIAKLNSKYIYNPKLLNIGFSMHTANKEQLTPLEVNIAFRQLLSQKTGYIPVYTDGSVSENGKAGCAVVLRSDTYQFRLPDHSSIFTAELFAILKAIEKIIQNNNSKFLICSDSYSSLQTLKSGDPNSLAHEIYNKITSTNKTIEFEWIPSHREIPGNEAADTEAKLALALPTADISPIPTSYNDFKSKIRKSLHKEWQDWWVTINTFPHAKTHLYGIKPTLKDWTTANQIHREEEISLARLRLGTCLFNKKHLFTRDPHPMCEFCQIPISTSHILLDCNHFANERAPILSSLRKNGLPIEVASILSENFPTNILIKYLKSINYYNKI